MAKKKSKKSTTKTKRVRRRTWDPVQVAEQYAPNVATAVGLDVLGLSEDQYVELLRDVLVSLIGDRVTKPKPETLVNAIKRNEKKVMPVVAAKLLEMIPEGKLTAEQLDFVMSYIGPLVIPFAQRLYREAKRLGADPSPLQAAWEEAWRLRGEPGPVGYCPKCGFRSVAPDGSCMVCGAVLDDEELRGAVEFDSKFKAFLEEASCSELKEALAKGSLYAGHASLHTAPKSKWDVEVLLRRADREALREALRLRCS
ncbi:MAG: hypothetical protein GXO07_00985 [Crenarchaeota archaeon]|nr:hypothetical protein [Thermoproteota archaeon]